ncbi:MAG: VanW family protein [Lachnospiraceae bacterium]
MKRWEQSTNIPANTTIDGVDVGGMLREQAQKACKDAQQKMLSDVRILIQNGKEEQLFTAEMLGVSTDIDQIISKAQKLGKGKNKNIVQNYFTMAKAKKSYKSTYIIDEGKLETAMQSYCDQNSQNKDIHYLKEELVNRSRGSIYAKKNEPIVVEDITPAGTMKIAEYVTESESEKDRDINLRVVCSKLDGIQIKPGEIFSANALIGQCTSEEGYVEAPIIMNQTELVDGMGGGICQAITGLYNAALLADMEIVQRQRHSFPVEYAPVGMDATMNGTDKDLKIKNRASEPIYISAEADKGKVTIALYGQKLEKEIAIKMVPEVKQEIEPGGDEVRFTKDLAPNEQQVMQEARQGYEVEVYREHYKKETLEQRELVSHDTYPAVNRIVMMGSSNMNK